MRLLVVLWSLALPVLAQEWENEKPTITTCKGANPKQRVCFGSVKEGGVSKGTVLCLGTAADECPSAADCAKEYKDRTDKKEWAAYAITGNNKLPPGAQASVPATKNCKLTPGKSSDIKSNQQLIKVTCGNSPIYLMAENKHEGASKEIAPDSITINGKVVDLKQFQAKGIQSSFKWIWLALTKQAIDNELNSDVKIQKVAAERAILDELKAQGVDLSKVNDYNTNIEFSYTPLTKGQLDQANFFYQNYQYEQIAVCEGAHDNKNYQTYFYAYPTEYQIKECDDAIVAGTAVSEVGMRSSQIHSVACFAKKDELYCPSAEKCMNDQYSENKLEMREPLTMKAGGQSGTKTAPN